MGPGMSLQCRTQDCIPVGCVPTASVATTSDQYLLTPGGRTPHPPPQPQKDHGTRQEVTLYPPVNRITGVKTLPFRNFVGGR